MNVSRLYKLTAGVVFTVALVLYLLTLAPTASFWDCGEFIAIASRLEVSHPPGAPFYMLIGRLFAMFAPTPDRIAVMVNLVSAIMSAFTILLTHLSIVRLVQHWQPTPSERTWSDHLSALVGGAVGALAFAASDSFWFNAVEAEVYAASMLFTALVVWLILRWSDEAAREEAHIAGTDTHPFSLSANRYLVLIAYMFGLAIGVHLLNLLAIFFCALIFFFAEYDRAEWTWQQRTKALLVAGLVASGVFLLVYPGVIQGIPTLAEKTNSITLTVLVIVAGITWFVWWTHTKRKLALNLLALALMSVLIGYSTYALLFIRSAANPPIDENDPENVESIVSYLKREQYGYTPLLSGESYNNGTGAFEQKSLPRRYSKQPDHVEIYRQYNSDLDFFLGYQVNYMYWRYFLWQFVGKDSDQQGAPAITGLGIIDDQIPNRLEFRQTPSEEKSQNAYFALPLLLGLFGMAYHYWRDWRRAFSVTALFLLTGIGIILYLNQYPNQPRERDYSYVASFFAFSLWIGIGATGLVELVAHALRTRESTARMGAYATAALAILAVPVLMMAVNYDDHDRTGQYVAPDYAYNMLQSVAPQGVMYTNGDNDTFPLWYLQEVEGVRQDVRVANLSLLQTPWYIKQLKNQASRTSAPVPMDLTDAQIEDFGSVGGVQWQPQTVDLPVPSPTTQALRTGSEVQVASSGVPGVRPQDAALVQRPMKWKLDGRPLGQDQAYLGSQDLSILATMRANAAQGWQRPLYFAVTVGRDGQIGLNKYFQIEGQAFRVVPVEHNEPLGRVADSITVANLRKFRFRGLNDPNVYFDENIRRMVDAYRNIFSSIAEGLVNQGQKAEAISILDTLMTRVPFSTIPGDARSFTFMARAYLMAGAKDKSNAILDQGAPLLASMLGSRQVDNQALGLNLALYAARLYLQGGETAKAEALIGRAEGTLTRAVQRGIFPAQEVQQIGQQLVMLLAAGQRYDAAQALGGRLATTLGDPALQMNADTLRSLSAAARLELGLDAPDTVATDRPSSAVRAR